MAVAQLVQHPSTYIEKLLRRMARLGLGSVAAVYLIPVHTLLFEKAVMPVQNIPQRIEVAYDCIILFLYAVAGRKAEGKNGAYQCKARCLYI